MRKELEIKKLKKDEAEALELKTLWQEKYEASLALLESAKKDLDISFAEYSALDDRVSYEHEVFKATNRAYQEVWEEFEEYREYTNSRIELLELKRDTENAEMEQNFRLADFAYRNNDRREASRFRSIAYDYRRKVIETSEQIYALHQEISAAKFEAEKKAPHDTIESYAETEKKLLEAQIRYRIAKEEYENRERDEVLCKKEYELACATLLRIQKALKMAMNR